MILINGIEADQLSVTDRGLLYGDGVWETIGVVDGKPQLLEWHLERLQQGLQALMIKPPDRDMLRHEISMTCAQQVRCILKLIITRGPGSRGYNPLTVESHTRILQTSPWASYPAEYAGQGIRLHSCETRLAHQPKLAGFKHLNRLEQVLARAEFGDEYQEGLVRDYAGHIIEGTMSNLFVMNEDGSITTPDLQMCGIAGVMRRFIMQTLENFGIQCHIRAVELMEVEQAKALFMTNSLIGLWPVHEFSNKTYQIPPLVRELQAAIQNLP
ncbi:MAG: aminodeoxychorismate lyase [Gammaproteobacteria bacterium]|nr:aminodeoxychorismate lyase [Gammaproteobacteria bacterium]MBU1722489.1 aminodeoxychorismate lyase [Gammaproteobacteria bacterium]MBU2005522.1 aminodeoxychorismate lyase [Gammaproteobacteria bacterium]